MKRLYVVSGTLRLTDKVNVRLELKSDNDVNAAVDAAEAVQHEHGFYDEVSWEDGPYVERKTSYSDEELDFIVQKIEDNAEHQSDIEALVHSLDEEVEAFKSAEGAAINSGGLREQLKYLLSNGMELSHLVTAYGVPEEVLDGLAD